jgi:hypothetical protein
MASLALPNPMASYPPGWSTFNEYAPHLGTGVFLFARGIGDVNRFAARYKAAKCFRSVQFESLSNDTVSSYSGLVQLLLTYSAFEYLLKCLGMEMKGSGALLSHVQRLTFLQNIRNLNGQLGVFAAVHSHVNKTYQQQLEQHLQGNDCNPWYLAGALRHSFAHGALTATPANVQPQAMGTVARFLSRGLILCMDTEFRERVRQFERVLHG